MTAYVSGKREGLIMEKPFIMGGNGRKEEYCVESALLDLVEENNLILKLSSSSSTQHDLTKNLKRLAQDRYTTIHLFLYLLMQMHHKRMIELIVKHKNPSFLNSKFIINNIKLIA